jgi:hypothetical protein
MRTADGLAGGGDRMGTSALLVPRRSTGALLLASPGLEASSRLLVWMRTHQRMGGACWRAGE